MKLVAYLSTALTEQLNILQKKSFQKKCGSQKICIIVLWEVHKETIKCALGKKVLKNNVFWKISTSKSVSKIPKKLLVQPAAKDLQQ